MPVKMDRRKNGNVLANALGAILGKIINENNYKWRRRRDSNPRSPCELNGFQDRRIQPLCHSSAAAGVCGKAARKASPQGPLKP